MAAPPAPGVLGVAAHAERLGAALDAIDAQLAQSGEADALVERLAGPVQILTAAAKEASDG